MFETKSLRRGILASVVALACSAISTVTLADDAIEEIVVSADFRKRTIEEVPASVTVLDRDEIDRLAVQHFEELISSVPNLNWSGDGNRARYFQIRGVGELEQYEGAPNPSIGFLIDDIDFSGIGTIATLFDIQQVEVLRGPQGTRYGANALGGLIYMQSVDPTDEWAGHVRVGAGQDDAVSGGIAFGGPLTSDGALKFRISAHRHESDGFRHNAFLGRDDTNARKETGFRGKLLWETSNDWQVRLATMLVDIDDGYDAFAIDNSFTVLSDKPGRDAQRSFGSSLKAVWSGSKRFEFTSVTSMANSDIDFGFDADWGNDEAWAPFTYDFISSNDRERDTLSQEFRLTSKSGGRLFDDTTDWLVGVYVLSLDEDLATLNEGTYFDPIAGSGSTLDDRLSSHFESANTALFGQMTMDVGDGGKLGFGLRAETRSTDYEDSADLRVGPGETMLGGKLSYTYAFDEELTAFAALSKGYKAGGFNLGPVPDGRREFGQEALWSLEAGVKGLWLDGSLSFDGTVFYNRRIDQQVRTSVQLNPNDPASFVFITDNAAKGRTIGLEGELHWRPLDTLEFYANVGLLRAKFDEFTSITGDLSGRDEAHAPRYTLAMGGAWRHPSGFFTRLDLSARDAFYFDVSHNQRSEPYTLAKARIGYATDRWTLQLWARNLFDEKYAVRGFYFDNEPPDFTAPQLYVRLGDPRQLGVTFDMRF